MSLAQAIATHGFTGVAYDRRGRGDSGDTKPYAVQREIEDLTAVISAAVAKGSPTSLPTPGVSSGGAPRSGGNRRRRPCRHRIGPRAALQGRGPAVAGALHRDARELEANGDREGILRYFHTRAVGLPEEMLDGMQGTPMWEPLLALTYTVRYDGLCMGPSQVMPDELLASIEAPVLAVSSTGTAMPFLPAAARAVAEGLPRVSTSSSRADSTRSPRRPSPRSSPTSSVEQPTDHRPRHPCEFACSARRPSGIRHLIRGGANAGLCSGGTTSRGGPGGVPSPKGDPPSDARSCSDAHTDRSGPPWDHPGRVDVRCTT